MALFIYHRPHVILISLFLPFLVEHRLGTHSSVGIDRKEVLVVLATENTSKRIANEALHEAGDYISLKKPKKV